MPASDDCPFCTIVADPARDRLIIDDDCCVAFLDRAPLFKGHVLVVPTTHVVTISDVEPALLGPLFERVQKMATAMTTALGAQGSFVAMNNVVSQSVAHLHVHVVPRQRGDGLRGFFWPRQRYESDAEMLAYVDRLRVA